MTNNNNDTSLTTAYKNAQGVIETWQNFGTMIEASLAKKVGWNSAANFIVAHDPAYSTGTITQGYNKGLGGYITPFTYLYGLIPSMGPQGTANGKSFSDLVSTFNQFSKISHDLAAANVNPADLKNIQPNAEDIQKARELMAKLPAGTKFVSVTDPKTPADPDAVANDFAKIFAAVRMAEAKLNPQTQATPPPARTAPQAAPVR